MEDCHLIPFYSKYKGRVEIQYCNLEREEAIIRGVSCTRRRIEGVPIYRDGILLGSCYQWVPAGQEKTTFDKGVDLTRSKIGLSVSEGSLKHFLKRSNA